MIEALCLLLFFAGHVVRDGWPSWKVILAGLVGTAWEWLYHLSTHLARISGAALCGVGAGAADGWLFGLGVFGAILVGFYVDMKHGEAGGVDTPTAIFDSFLSGITSVIPLGLLLVWMTGSWFALAALAVGLFKPLIWTLAWRIPARLQTTWLQPTRIAAGTFGVFIGAAVIITKAIL